MQTPMQTSSRMLAPGTNASSSHKHRPTTCVNGIGMYESWKRNFKSPFFAMLDIFDNAIDAGFTNTTGSTTTTAASSTNISATPSANIDIISGADEVDNNNNNSFDGIVELCEKFTTNPFVNQPKSKAKTSKHKRAELVIVNNSFKEICPLEEILEIHSSAKGKNSVSIGENGVGLKQGCAALSDLSFVFIKNKDKLSFGIIARCLQHEEGCYLPSFELNIDDIVIAPNEDETIDENKQDLEKIIQNLTEILNYKDLDEVAKCVENYGYGSIKYGIQLLAEHLHEIKSDSAQWKAQDNVFKLVITDIHDERRDDDGDKVTVYNNHGLLSQPSCDDSSDDDTVMEEEEEEEEEKKLEDIVSSAFIPRRRSGRQSTSSSAKETTPTKSPSTQQNSPKKRIVTPFQNLLELMEKELPLYYIHIPDNFKVFINTKQVTFNYWQRYLVEPMRFDQKIDDVKSFREMKSLQEPGASNVSIRIFCGFNPIRLVDQTQTKALSLFIYSRRSGRLIKHVSDGRTTLGLTAGGTNFCQGLTCIIDDFNGSIPLNPTKQDVAFGERRNGEIMGENIYAWSAALVSLYYRFHLNKYVEARKGDLTKELEPLAEALTERYSNYSSNSIDDNGLNLKQLAKAEFGTLDGFVFRLLKGRLIAPVNSKLREIDGIDSLFKLQGNLRSSKKKGAKKVTKPQSAVKRTPRRTPANKSVEKEEIITLSARRRGKVSYVESDTDDFDTEPEEVTSSVTALKRKKKQAASGGMGELEKQLEQAKSINAKQKHDYDILMEVKNNLQQENETMFEEMDDLKANQRSMNSSNAQERNADYDMLVEVKNNLQDENDRLNDEVEFLNKRLETLEKKLKQEREMRELAQDEVETLMERTRKIAKRN